MRKNSDISRLAVQSPKQPPEAQRPSAWVDIYTPIPGAPESGFVADDESYPESGLGDITSAQSSSSEPRVPETLCSDTDDLTRLRDEDPKVMPIPRKLEFQFDPHQLRDLAVIKDGGNGCARISGEDDIEDEYEWGGGALKSWKKSRLWRS